MTYNMHVLVILCIVLCVIARVLQWICTDMVEIVRYHWNRAQRF